MHKEALETLGVPAHLLAMLGLDTHHHKCAAAGCGQIWSHSRADINNSREHDAAHKCPKCGTKQIEKCEADGSELRLSFKLSERELSTVLAALRGRQQALDDNAELVGWEDIATQNGRFPALTANEIEHLGDRLHGEG